MGEGPLNQIWAGSSCWSFDCLSVTAPKDRLDYQSMERDLDVWMMRRLAGQAVGKPCSASIDGVKGRMKSTMPARPASVDFDMPLSRYRRIFPYRPYIPAGRHTLHTRQSCTGVFLSGPCISAQPSFALYPISEEWRDRDRTSGKKHTANPATLDASNGNFGNAPSSTLHTLQYHLCTSLLYSPDPCRLESSVRAQAILAVWTASRRHPSTDPGGLITLLWPLPRNIAPIRSLSTILLATTLQRHRSTIAAIAATTAMVMSMVRSTRAMKPVRRGLALCQLQRKGQARARAQRGHGMPRQLQMPSPA